MQLKVPMAIRGTRWWVERCIIVGIVFTIHKKAPFPTNKRKTYHIILNIVITIIRTGVGIPSPYHSIISISIHSNIYETNKRHEKQSSSSSWRDRWNVTVSSKHSPSIPHRIVKLSVVQSFRPSVNHQVYTQMYLRRMSFFAIPKSKPKGKVFSSSTCCARSCFSYCSCHLQEWLWCLVVVLLYS